MLLEERASHQSDRCQGDTSRAQSRRKSGNEIAADSGEGSAGAGIPVHQSVSSDERGASAGMLRGFAQGCGLGQGSDAQRFRTELEERLGLFGLEVAGEKTKVLEFGPFAASKARARGEKPQTFDFLGLTHYCSRTRNGQRFRMKRLASRKNIDGT